MMLLPFLFSIDFSDEKKRFHFFIDSTFQKSHNIKLNTDLSTYINKESFHVNILADYYNHKKPKDTINDFIFSLILSYCKHIFEIYLAYPNWL